MSQLRVNAVTDETGGNTATINGMTPTAQSLQGFRNRILNGGMVIDQRNNGASVTPASGAVTYTVDRWKYYVSQASKLTAQQNAGAVTPPTGFTNYLGTTSSSAYSVISSDLFTVYQAVEGFNSADFAWGTSSAAAVTVSFWVRSSLTGTHSGAVQNSANNRSYVFTFTVNSANTWEQKTITIAGDQSGTWLTNNGIGLSLYFNLGAGSTYSTTAGSWQAGNLIAATGAVSVVGTSGATFYITGVQLEAGSVATPFERRDYGREVMLCQRYYWNLENIGNSISTAPLFCFPLSFSSTYRRIAVRNPVKMRTAPTVTVSAYAGDGGVIAATFPKIDAVTTTDLVPLAADLTSATGYSQITGLTASAEL